MNTTHEVQRLADVYRGYGESTAAQTRWDEYNPGNHAILQERQHTIKQLLTRESWLTLQHQRVLDVGCGTGKELARLLSLGATPQYLYGVDLLPDRIATAQQQHPALNFVVGNAEALAFPDGYFDLVLLFTVFTSILDAQMAENVSREVLRVLRPGGAVLWYDFRYNNPRNPHVHGMPRATIKSHFPECQSVLRTITLLPPLARRLGRLVPTLYPVLASIPFLRTHYMGLLIKPV